MALYGYHPPSIISYLRENSKIQAVEHHIKNQQQVLKLLKDNLTLAHNRMKQEEDQHRCERSFDVGEWVFLRLQPYKQMSLKQAQKDNKLSKKYYGLYKVFQKIGTMAYKLELPAASRVHPVFHVSCLKKVIVTSSQFKQYCQNLKRKTKSYWNRNQSQKQELDNYKIDQFRSISSSGRIYPLKIPRGRMIILYKSTQNYSSVEENAFQKERGMLGPYNTSDCPITIVLVSFIVIIVPLLSPYCY